MEKVTEWISRYIWLSQSKCSFYYSDMIIAVICFCISLHVIDICVLIIQHYVFRYIQCTYSLHTQYLIFYNIGSLYKRNYFPVSLISTLLNNHIECCHGHVCFEAQYPPSALISLCLIRYSVSQDALSLKRWTAQMSADGEWFIHTWTGT